MVRTRRDARERALSLCYELDVRGSVLDDLLFELPVAPAPYAVELARKLIDGGAPGLHLYAFNQHETVLSVLDRCGLLPSQAQPREKELA